jgi:hypothetical protein
MWGLPHVNKKQLKTAAGADHSRLFSFPAQSAENTKGALFQRAR